MMYSFDDVGPYLGLYFHTVYYKKKNLLGFNVEQLEKVSHESLIFFHQKKKKLVSILSKIEARIGVK